MDDLLLLGNDYDFISSFKTALSNTFTIKDLGPVSYVLGLTITRDRSKRTITLSQSSYVRSLVAKFRLDPDSRSSARTVPLSKSDWLTAVDADHSLAAPLPPHLPYRSLLGGILYANVCSRPDVSFAVSALASHNSDPKQMHWNALINLLKFMRDTQNLSITYGSSISHDDINELRVYADADFSRHPERRRSRSGHVIYFNGGAICWKSSHRNAYLLLLQNLNCSRSTMLLRWLHGSDTY